MNTAMFREKLPDMHALLVIAALKCSHKVTRLRMGWWTMFSTLGVIIAVIALIAIAGFVLRIFYIRPVRDIIRERDDEKPLKKDVSNLGISEKSLRRLTHSFSEEETEVYMADRPDLASIAGAIAWSVLDLALLIAAICLFILWSSFWIASMILFLLGLVLFIAYPWNEWLKWRADIRLITNVNFRHEEQPWAFAMWLWNNERHDPLPLHFIISVKTRSTIWGRVCRYATVELKMIQQADQDPETREVHFVRNLPAFRAEMEKRMKAAKELQGTLTVT